MNEDERKPDGEEGPVKANDHQLSVAREATVAGMSVRRLLPSRPRRTIGAWCFIDHYGPLSVDGVAGMRCRRTRISGCRP